MFIAIISLASVFAFLCTAEFMWRRKIIHGEVARKIVHISIGSFVALWPFIMSFNYIQVISIAFLLVNLLSRRFKIFNAVHAVSRSTWGEVFFALSIGLLPFITDSRLIFMVAVLHMSLADGFAGLIGSKFGKSSEFGIFTQTKSIVGSLTFLFVSYLLVLGYFKASPFATKADINFFVLIVPIFATLLEVISVKGSDNIMVPLLVALVLSSAVG